MCEEDAFRKVRVELSVLWVILSISLGISSAMIGDAARAFSGDVIFSLGFVHAIMRALEFVVGIFWLFLTLGAFKEAAKIKRKRRYALISRKAGKEETLGVLRDLIAFYRGYYGEVKKMLLLLLFTGLAMITSAVYLFHSGVFTTEEFCFNISIGIAATIFSIGAYRFINEKWGKKLLRIESEEKILRDFLGETH
ncbi:MAG: hypothetical protein QW778_03535 [Candidatus Micrarchaeaceae archaeon]